MSELSYDYVEQTISSSLECPICRSPLVEPIMPRACQHLFCTSCLHRALDLSSTCPIDRMRIRNRKEELADAPRVVIDLLEELRIRCQGCREELRREEWGRHESKCSELGKLEESKNGGKGKGKAQSREGSHKVTDKTSGKCQFCAEQIEQSEVEAHMESCSIVPRPCRYCTESLVPARLATHLLDSCPLVPTPCPHASFGCTYIGPRESLPADHLYSDCAYEPLKDCFERFNEREREWENENYQLRQKVRGLEDRLEDVEGLLRDAKYSLGDYLQRTPSSEALKTSGKPLPPPPLVSTLSNLASRNTSLSTSLNTLTQSQTDSLHTTQHLVEELNSMRSVIGGMRMQMGDLMRTVQYLSSTAGSSRDHLGGAGFTGEGPGIGKRMMRPVLGSRRSDSSSDEQDQDPYHDVDRYLSSSASDPEEDLLMFSSPSAFSHRQEPFSRPPPMSMMTGPGSYLPPNRSTWTPGFDYGPGGGGGPPSRYGFGAGPPSRPPFLGPGVIDRRNGRVPGGIGGGMKL